VTTVLLRCFKSLHLIWCKRPKNEKAVLQQTRNQGANRVIIPLYFQNHVYLLGETSSYNRCPWKYQFVAALCYSKCSLQAYRWIRLVFIPSSPTQKSSQLFVHSHTRKAISYCLAFPVLKLCKQTEKKPKPKSVRAKQWSTIILQATDIACCFNNKNLNNVWQLVTIGYPIHVINLPGLQAPLRFVANHNNVGYWDQNSIFKPDAAHQRIAKMHKC